MIAIVYASNLLQSAIRLSVIASCLVSVSTKAGTVNEEGRLLSNLVINYNRHARPISNVFSSVNVSISFYITKILGLDEKNQVLTTFGWLEVLWTDEYLTWDPAEYGGVTRIVIPPDMLWLPDFGLENSAEAIYDDQADKKFRAAVNHDGSVQWVPGGKYTTSCQLDISLYPFDHQTCGLDFVDWTYDGRYVKLLNSSSKIGLDVYKTHGEWDITSTEALRFDQFFGSDPGIPFPTVRFVLHLQRKPRYYLINVVAPCVLMSLLAMLVFYLPPDSGEKVSLGITVLLSFSVFLLLVADNVPKTSDDVPLIAIYLTMVMVMAAVSIFASVVVLDLHHQDATRAVPPWLRTLVFGYVARLLSFLNPYKQECMRLREVAVTNSFRVKYEGVPREEPNGREHKTSSKNGLHGLYDELELMITHRKNLPMLEEILVHLREITAKMRKTIKRDHIKHEWRMLAKIIDRFLMIVFVSSILILTVSILYIVPYMYRDTGRI